LVEQQGRLKTQGRKKRKEKKLISEYHRDRTTSTSTICATTYNPHIPRLTPDLHLYMMQYLGLAFVPTSTAFIPYFFEP